MSASALITSVLARALTTSHVAIGRRYLAAGAVGAIVGGTQALLMRWQLACPGVEVPLVGDLFYGGSGGVIGPASYARLFTSHGLVMIFFAISPVLIGWLGHAILPLQIGASAMAFPRVSRLGFWLFLGGQALALASFFVPGGTAAAGWTSYPPLSTLVGSPGLGQSVMALALLAAGASTVVSAINIVVTVILRRARGLALIQMPQLAWGLMLASILNALFVPVIAAAMLLLLCDRHLGTSFFIAGAGLSPEASGDPLVYQQLFWIFGHPEVYVLILPTWGIIGDLIGVFTGRAPAWHRGTIGAFIAVTILSGLVYGHHLYTAGLSPMLGAAFQILTMLVSLPAMLIVINWLHSLWLGSVRVESPMLYALGAMLAFGLGGLTGIPLASVTANLWLHDTAYVVGHFHLTMAAATLLAAFAAFSFWFPLLTGRRLSERPARLHAVATLVLLVLAFGGMLVAGYAGQHRRLSELANSQAAPALAGLNVFIGGCVLALVAAQVIFVVNVVRSWRSGPLAGSDPWGAATREGTREPTPDIRD